MDFLKKDTKGNCVPPFLIEEVARSDPPSEKKEN